MSKSESVRLSYTADDILPLDIEVFKSKNEAPVSEAFA